MPTPLRIARCSDPRGSIADGVQPPAWRSMLYVPANVERFVSKASSLDVDAVQLDLEDGVAEADKDAARAAVAASAARIRPGGADVIVRINAPLGMAVRDIEASIGPDVCALNLAKTSSPDHVRLLVNHVALVEQRAGIAMGSTKLLVTIEDPEALGRALAIFRASDRVVGAMLGTEDFAAVTGAAPNSQLVEHAKLDLVLAATAAGITPFGTLGSIANFKDLETLRNMTRRSKASGFRGASCVHPSQAAVLNEEFAPSAEEAAWARSVIERFGDAADGAIALNGAMIDLPVFRRAQGIVARIERIEMRRARLQPAGRP